MAFATRTGPGVGINGKTLCLACCVSMTDLVRARHGSMSGSHSLPQWTLVSGLPLRWHRGQMRLRWWCPISHWILSKEGSLTSICFLLSVAVRVPVCADVSSCVLCVAPYQPECHCMFSSIRLVCLQYCIWCLRNLCWLMPVCVCFCFFQDLFWALFHALFRC